MSWSGETHIFQYTAYVENSAGQETSQILPWRSSTASTASVTFSSLSAGTYTVWVVKQTNDGTWIKFGETTCSVTSSSATPTPSATPTSVPTSGDGTIGCSTGTSSITVTLDPEEGTTSWEVTATHSTGYPRLGQSLSASWSQEQLDILNNDDPEDDLEVFREGPAGDLPLTHTFTTASQGTWNVTGHANISDQAEQSNFPGITCTVAGGL